MTGQTWALPRTDRSGRRPWSTLSTAGLTGGHLLVPPRRAIFSRDNNSHN